MILGNYCTLQENTLGNCMKQQKIRETDDEEDDDESGNHIEA